MAVTFHENELEKWESELGTSGGCSSCTDTPKKQLLCDFRGKWSDTTHGAFQQLKKVVVAPLTSVQLLFTNPTRATFVVVYTSVLQLESV